MHLVDLALAHFIRTLDPFDKVSIGVHAVALLENDRADLGQGFLKTFCLDSQLRATQFNIGVIGSTPSFHLLHAFLDIFALDARQVSVSLSNVLVSFLR